MVNAKLFIGALLVSSASAFTPVPSSTTRPTNISTLNAAEVDGIGNNIAVKNLLNQVEGTQLLTKVAQAGLLTKAQASGISLTKLEPLLKLAASNKDVMILLEASAPQALPLLPKIVDLAPSALPLLGAAIQVPPVALQGAAVASVAAAGAAVAFIPDDTVVQVATQTLLVGVLAAAAAASVAGSAAISYIKD